MPVVIGETLRPINTFLLSTAIFYSRIILRKLNHAQLQNHRKVERYLFKVIKLKADIKFLEVYREV